MPPDIIDKPPRKNIGGFFIGGISLEIFRISQNTVKIHIGKSELNKLGISSESLEKKDFKAQLLFSALFDTVGIKPFEKTYVEIFDAEENGCVIYVSKIVAGKKKTLSRQNEKSCYLTVQTKTPEKLFRLAKQLYGCDDGVGSILKSKLYNRSGEYRLVVRFAKSCETEVKTSCGQKSVRLFFGKITACVTDEHWKKIIAEKAVERLIALS